MTNRQKALEALSKANLEVVEKAEETITQWKDTLITANECYNKLKELFFTEFQQIQDYGSKEVASLYKTKTKEVA